MIALLLVQENEYYGGGVVHRPLDNHDDNTDDATIAMTTLSVLPKKKNFKIVNLNDDDDDDNENDEQIQIEQHQPPRIAIAPRRTSSVVSFIDDFTIDDDDVNDDDDDAAGDSSSQGSAAASIATTQYHEVLNLDDYTKQEKQDCWYTRTDYFEIRDRVKLELSLYWLDKMNTNGGVVVNDDDDDSEYCVRGLERRTHTAKTLRHTTRSQAIRAVLYEMECQKHNGYTNQNMVADVYREYSIPSTIIAQTIANQDEMDAANAR